MMASTAPDKRAARYAGNLLLPLIILALSAVFFVQTLEFPDREDVGPAAVPHLWMFFIAVFCLQLVVQAVRRKGGADPVPGRIGFVLAFIAWLAVYLMAIETIGYFVSTFVFLVGSMLVLSYRNVLVVVSVSLGWLVFSYFIFYRMLFIPLPVGSLLRPVLG